MRYICPVQKKSHCLYYMADFCSRHHRLVLLQARAIGLMTVEIFPEVQMALTDRKKLWVNANNCTSEANNDVANNNGLINQFNQLANLFFQV